MPELILGIFDDNKVPIETAICLSVFEYTLSSLQIIFIKIEGNSINQIKYNLLEETQEHIKNENPGQRTIYTSLPTIVLDDGISFIAGLAAVLRQIVKCSSKVHLLGFRECCLAAPAEVSCWTRFCEVDIVNCLELLILNPSAECILESTSDIEQINSEFKSKIGLNDLFKDRLSNGKRLHYSFLPVDLGTLEYHLSIPAKVHNRGKYGEGGPNHNYVEGPSMVLSDLVIALCVHLILDYLSILKADVLPFTIKWLNRVKTEGDFSSCLSRVFNTHVHKVRNNIWLLPNFKDGPVDLYKKEGCRRKKIFTQRDLLSSCLDVISEVKLMEYIELYNINDLESIKVVLPDVPVERLERKTQQLTNLAKAALQVAKEGDVIADLCCGSGHLGILLATLLPSCTVILLDNKEKSLERAKLRTLEMNLTNVRIVQSNLDYFTAKFEVGVSLHACGVASDLVINKCLNSKAHVVLCPCCYGGIQSNHIVRYPQSSTFIETGLGEHSFFVLAHNADTCDTESGHLAMTAVDTDRCLYLSQQGYSVTLSKLQPLNCTTRNNLIVAKIHCDN